MLNADPQEILRSLSILYRPDDLIEMRILKTDRLGTVSGYFRDRDKLTKALCRYDGKAPGLYLTLNPCKQALYARSADHVREHARTTTSDPDILCRRWILVDVDPERPAEVSSTDDEHQLALERTLETRLILGEKGFPVPVVADSGNGGHLLLPADLPNTDEAKSAIEDFLAWLEETCGDQRAKIDQTVFNAARIVKAYGTVSRKGDDLPERPHRLARLVEVPASFTEFVTLAMLAEFKRRALVPVKSNGHVAAVSTNGLHGGFDLERFIATHLEAREPVATSSGRKWVLEHCPFNPDHGAPDAAVFEHRDGGLGFRCLHDSCKHKHWSDLRKLCEGNGHRTASEKPQQKPFLVTDVPPVWSYEAVVTWMLQDLLLEASVTLLTGDAGVGKSHLALMIASRVASGADFLGYACIHRKVLYLDRENPLAIVKERLWRLGITPNSDLIVWGNWVEHSPEGPSAPSVVAFVKEHKPLVIFDSLVAFHDGKEQDASETRRHFQCYRNLTTYGGTVLILHNTGKGESSKEYRGSSDIKGSVDAAYLLERSAEEGAPLTGLGDLRLTPFKSRVAPAQVMRLRYENGSFSVPDHKSRTTIEAVEDLIRAWPNISHNELIKLAMGEGYAKNRIESALIEGVQSGRFAVASGHRGKRHFKLASSTLLQ